jgi:hypothetical protein
MNYAKIISTVVLLGAMNMDATGKVVQYGLSAELAHDGKTIMVSNVATQAVLRKIAYPGRVGAFTDVVFKDAKSITATMTGGICPDHAESITQNYDIYPANSSCITQ